MQNLSQIAPQVIKLSRQVGTFILQESKKIRREDIEKKGRNDLVSYVDRNAETKIVEGLSQILPDSAFFTEENPDSQQLTDKPYHWIIDPLDGTTNFLHGLPIFAVSIGLMYDNKLVLGVIYEPNRDECFYAIAGEGAFCNEQAIKVSPVPQLADSLLATGFPYRDFEKIPAYLDIIREFMQKSHGLRRMGSAAIDLAYVACGRFEGFFEYNLSPWDVAAGALIIKEAGGQVSTFSGGNDFVFGREIVAAGNIHAEMQSLIAKHWKR